MKIDRITWQPTAKDELYRRTGEVAWDCTACCLDGHEARAHDGHIGYALDFEGRVKILRADPCLLLAADAFRFITEGVWFGPNPWPPFGQLEGDLLRIKAANLTVIYRLTRQPYNDRPSGATPSVAEVFPPQGEFYLAEWPD